MGGAVLELFAKLGMDSSEYDKGLEDAKGKGNKFASFLGGVGKAGAAAFTAVGAATVAMGKQAVDSYANFEQLWGGVQKLYGEAAETVKENAEKAYMSSGMSMNEYMQTATQFSAALTKSLNGDVQESARITDIAMRAISDNVNTFGSDAEFVTNAFMGLSRQNYTMIDNLKLGYAGTKQGMLELINDSGVLGYTLTDTSQLAEVGFANMVLAIEEVQKQQHIAGTTAKEAMFTIEGSAKATQSAWKNVITAIGKGEGLGSALDDLTTAVFGNGEEGSGFLANIIPRIQTTMESIGDFVVQAGPLLAEKIPQVLDAVLPSVFDTVTKLTASLATFIFSKLPDILSTLYQVTSNLVGSVSKFILENLPAMIESGVAMLNGIAEGIRNNLPEIIAAASDFIAEFLGEILYELPDIVAAGINIVMGLVEGLITSIPSVLDALGVLIDKGWHAITNFDWVSIGKNIIDGIANGISNFGGAIADKLTSIASNAWRGVKRFFGISSPSRLMRDTIGKFIPLGIAEGIEDAADSVYNEMEDLGDGTVDAYNTDFDDIFSTKVSGKPDGATVNYGGITFNIYGAEGQNPEDIARAVRDVIISEEERNKIVYA